MGEISNGWIEKDKFATASAPYRNLTCISTISTKHMRSPASRLGERKEVC